MTATKSIPLLQFFSCLKCVMFCGYHTQEEEDNRVSTIDTVSFRMRDHVTSKTGVCCRPFVRLWEQPSPRFREPEQNKKIARGLMKTLSSAMHFRLLPPDLWVEDCSEFVLCCNMWDESCELCSHVRESLSLG
jgi:hypothetical protein